jgi:hypothetical protein
MEEEIKKEIQEIEFNIKMLDRDLKVNKKLSVFGMCILRRAMIKEQKKIEELHEEMLTDPYEKGKRALKKLKKFRP